MSRSMKVLPPPGTAFTMTELQLQTDSVSVSEQLESSMARKKKHNNKQEVLLCWSFPRRGWYKLNVDGSYRSGSRCIGGGGVIRNQDGEWLCGFAENLGTGKKPIEAELWALYRGLELAWNSGLTPVEVETDSAMAVNLVCKPVELHNHSQFKLIRNYQQLIRNCQNLLTQIWNYSVQHVYRQKNSVADFLATFGLTLEPGCHYFDAPPPGCEAVLVQDICRVAQPRFLAPTVIEYRRVKKLEELNTHQEKAASATFTWKIDNFSKLDAVKHYSDAFVIGCFEWRILVYPRGNNSIGYLSLYLDVTGSSTLPKGWARHVRFSLTVVNQLQSSKSITNDTGHVFNKKERESGFASLIPLSEFSDHREGYLVNDICIIEAKVAVHKSEIKLLEDRKSCSVALVEPLDKTIKEQQIRPQVLKRCRSQDAPSSEQVYTEPTDSPANPPIVKEPKEDVPSPPTGELADFRGLGNIDNAFVPLLDEVCSWHPFLIECQRKRSRIFTEWAFTALGRLLHFMKTKKVKDMTADACEELKLLWEGVEAFKFDLAWLEPRVQRALGMKKIVEKAGKLKRLRDDVDALQTQAKRLRAELAVAEVNLEARVRDFDKTQEGSDKIDMDSELGYGRG